MQDNQKNPETLKTRNSLESLPVVKLQDPPKPAKPSEFTNYLDKRHSPDASADRKSVEAPDVTETSEGTDLLVTSQSTETSHSPSLWSSLKSPLLAIAAAAGVLSAAWNYTTLENTRLQLTAANDAKAAVDASLAEAKGRLAAAEKAVADVKAALTSVPAIAAAPAAKAAATAEPAKATEAAKSSEPAASGETAPKVPQQ